MPTSDTPLLSIVIPVLNEAATLPSLLADIARQQGVRLEVIVGDGGSTDASGPLALAGGARFIRAPRGRGAQMNAAAHLAQGAYLLFLHADSRLPHPHLLAHALRALGEAMSSSPRVAGHFCLHFQRANSGNTLFYQYMEAKTRLNRVNTTNGDQGVLLTKQWFAELGGFDERMPFLEDQRLAERIRHEGQWMTLPGVLVTSARRFEIEGFLQRYLSMGLIMLAFSTGLDEFFTRLPGLYRLHHQCGRLLLAPILSGFWATLFAERRFSRIAPRVERIGRYLGENCWQLVFFIEVCFRSGGGQQCSRLLPLYDRWISPVFHWRVVGIVLGWVTVVLLAGLGTPLVWLLEGRRERSLKK